MRYPIVYFMIVLIFIISCEKESTEPENNSMRVKDIDGNKYDTVAIGDQVWILKNLRVTHYRNGDSIPEVTDPTEWEILTTGAYCNYNNDAVNVGLYGRLYNWHAVNDIRGLAPEGWHIPCDEEWQTLRTHLGGSFIAGGKLKESGNVHWNSPNTGATNESGFTALPAGWRYYTGDYIDMGYTACFWSSSNTPFNDDGDYFIIYWRLEYNSAEDFRIGYSYPQSGFSIRCIKD